MNKRSVMKNLSNQQQKTMLEKSVIWRISLPKTLLAMFGIILGLNLHISLAAQELQAQPIPKIGNCPSGYSSSGGYCVPGKSSHYAIEKRGSCASGYSTSGDYCLAGNNAKLAIHKEGSCPSGWSASGNYCLSTR
jgi:hypothetical protein